MTCVKSPDQNLQNFAHYKILPSSSNVSSLELLLCIHSQIARVARDAIVLGVLAALSRGVAHLLLGVVFTFKMVGGAMNNLGDWLSFLRKDSSSRPTSSLF
jgi:hypothetical protein